MFSVALLALVTVNHIFCFPPFVCVYVHMHLKNHFISHFLFPLIRRNILHGERTDANIPPLWFKFWAGSSDSGYFFLLLAFFMGVNHNQSCMGETDLKTQWLQSLHTSCLSFTSYFRLCMIKLEWFF